MAQCLHRECSDVDEQAEALSGYQQRYEQLGLGRFRGSMWQVVMAGGVVFRESTNLRLRQQVTPPADQVALAVLLSAQPGSTLAGRPLGPDSLMVLTGHEQYDIALAGEADLIGISVHRSLAQALAPAKQDWLHRAERQRHLSLSPDAIAAIQQVLLAVCRQSQAGLDRLGDPASERALLASTWTQAVILAMVGEEREEAIPRRAETRQRVVQRAVAFMHAHLDGDLSIAELGSAACTSRRTLQYCFEELLHTTPQAYWRALRLNQARRLLKSHPLPAITAIASQLGFSDSSHFTRHYKLMFGELPSQTQRGLLSP